MAPEIQTIAALAVVAVTVALLARSLLKKKSAPGCGGGCGCPSEKMKADLVDKRRAGGMRS
ncbi:hypothetical protein CMV30_08775 [Nibricoccus aquaticus]|uniref:FeoB-associated Cys-rich membrane protein n=1 Tax=Nibricoccus aquaticus TaxID=2576891 RepID=A0A290Q6B5_9BACT|nr:hypothetical protein CMV30_08775 [Nibricoccus aquaticus]